MYTCWWAYIFNTDPHWNFYQLQTLLNINIKYTLYIYWLPWQHMYMIYWTCSVIIVLTQFFLVNGRVHWFKFYDHLLEGKRVTLSSYTLHMTYQALLLTKVNSLVPVSINVLIKFSGIPHNSKSIFKSTLLHHNDIIINTYLLWVIWPIFNILNSI